MKIPFACAFMKLLASDDNTNYASYLLNFGLALFSQPDIKHEGVYGSSANFPPKTFPEKIMQIRYVYARSCVCMGTSFLTMGSCILENEIWPILLTSGLNSTINRTMKSS